MSIVRNASLLREMLPIIGTAFVVAPPGAGAIFYFVGVLVKADGDHAEAARLMRLGTVLCFYPISFPYYIYKIIKDERR